MLNLSEYKVFPDQLSDLLPWALLAAPGIVMNKDGSFQRTFRFRGGDVDSSTEESLVAHRAQVNNALKRLDAGWSVFVEAQRKDSFSYEDSFFPDSASRLIDAERKMFFNEKGNHFESDYYLTLVYLPPADKYQKFGSKLIENTSKKDTKVNYKQYLEMFVANTDRIANMLKTIMPLFRPLNDEQTLSYLHYSISMKEMRVEVPETPMYLDAVLVDEPLCGGWEPKLGKYHIRTISITSFPGTTFPGILEEINRLSIEYRWVSRYIALDKLEAEKEISKYRRTWFSKRKSALTMVKESIFQTESINVDEDAVQKSSDAAEALAEVSGDFVSYGYFTATVTVWDEDLDILNEKVKLIEKAINSKGFVAKCETINAVQSWLSSLPGHVYANVRRPLVSSLNLIDMLPMNAVWAGQKYNVHLNDAPLFYATTSGSTPFRFVNHIGDVGHTIVLGPTGAGKSVLLNFIEMQFRRYANAQIFIFDKGASALIPTLAVGGKFYNIGKDSDQLSFQPLADIHLKEDREWAQEWIESILVQENITVNPDVKSEIWTTLETLSKRKKVERTLSNFVNLVQHSDVRSAVKPYILGGSYGALFDADNDNMAVSAFQCFEMEQLMHSQGAMMPALAYLFHKLEKRFDGRPTLLVLDEAWVFLDNPMFASKIREWLKTLRKANVSVIFATQSIADAMESSIAPALIESCPVRIFLPNDRAMEEGQQAYYRKFDLNKTQIQLLATAQKKKDYYFQSSIGNRMFDLELEEIALAFCTSTSKQDRALVQEILKEYGEGGFLEAFMKAKNIDWALEYLGGE